MRRAREQSFEQLLRYSSNSCSCIATVYSFCHSAKDSSSKSSAHICHLHTHIHTCTYWCIHVCVYGVHVCGVYVYCVHVCGVYACGVHVWCGCVWCGCVWYGYVWCACVYGVYGACVWCACVHMVYSVHNDLRCHPAYAFLSTGLLKARPGQALACDWPAFRPGLKGRPARL